MRLAALRYASRNRTMTRASSPARAREMPAPPASLAAALTAPAFTWRAYGEPPSGVHTGSPPWSAGVTSQQCTACGPAHSGRYRTPIEPSPWSVTAPCCARPLASQRSCAAMRTPPRRMRLPA